MFSRGELIQIWTRGKRVDNDFTGMNTEEEKEKEREKKKEINARVYFRGWANFIEVVTTADDIFAIVEMPTGFLNEFQLNEIRRHKIREHELKPNQSYLDSRSKFDNYE